MIELKDSNGVENYVKEGGSANIIATFEFDGEAFNKAALITLTLTLYDLGSKTVINSREDQDILDDNSGAVATDGTLTMELDADDNVIVDDDLEAGQGERHVARFTWTWNDGDGVRTGMEEMSFLVEKLNTVA